MGRSELLCKLNPRFVISHVSDRRLGGVGNYCVLCVHGVSVHEYWQATVALDNLRVERKVVNNSTDSRGFGRIP